MLWYHNRGCLFWEGMPFSMDNLTGTIERITFYNAENGYSVIRLRPERRNVPGLNREGLVTAVGNLPEPTPGLFLRLTGQWETHPEHGLQFAIQGVEQSLPATVEGIRRYLGSGLVKGIGPRLAERIVKQFGSKTLEVLDTHADLLTEVPDIGARRMMMIAEAWEQQKKIKEIMLFLHGHGVNTTLAVKIYKQYGDQSLQVVQADPYRLAQDIYGVGFKTADKLARDLGLPADHPSRLEAGLVYALNEMANEGHVYSPEQALLDRATELLEVDPALMAPALERLSQEDRVRLDHLQMGQAASTGQGAAEMKAVYLTPFYHGETGVAERLRALAQIDQTRLFSLQENLPGIDPLSLLTTGLSPEQMKAVRIALEAPVSVLTGGPGTGKTTAIRALIEVLETEHHRYALAAPTGRAAKRISEATGHQATTIHRLLGYNPGKGFQYHQENPLPVDMLVVDEASMLDLLLANHLLIALSPGTHLVLVGDVDQLPSVGAGDVLRDIIASGAVPVTSLTQIFRQAAGSQIITNAHRIHQGAMPVMAVDNQDFFFFPAPTPEDAASWVEQVVVERIPSRFGLDPKNEIQVLSPMYRGPVGVDALNSRLQAVLNPPSPGKLERSLFGRLFRVGDRVMQTENNYDKDVYNGDIGRVTGLSLEDHTLLVTYDGAEISYDFSEADQLCLAYAISVHKSQGSEFPAVVIPMVTQHYLMLQRNLLYTAVTRARTLVVLVGDRRAIGIAIHNNKVAARYTALDQRLNPAHKV